MNTTPKKRTRTVAASTAALVGSGLVVAAVPAEASVPAEPAVVGVADAAVAQFTRSTAQGPLIVHRTGTVSARAAIAAAPKMTPAKKKAKKKYRSKRS